MNRAVKKTDALAEMVKAFEQNDTKRSNRISDIIQKSIALETKEQRYRKYIEVNREEKQLFPKKQRYSANITIGEASVSSDIILHLQDGTYVMEIDNNGQVIFRKEDYEK